MRRALPRLVFALAVFGIALAGCDKVEVVTPDPPRVSISPSSITIDVGERTRLIASISGGGTGGSVSWTSSNPALVSVDASGEITGLAVGTVTITARSGGGLGTASVIVRPPTSVLLDRPAVSFTAAPGGVAGPETVEITAPGPDGMTGLTLTTRYTPGQAQGWLRTALSSTSTPASLLISGDARALDIGTYTATIEITATGSTAISIAVTLQVVGAPPTIALNSETVGFAANEAGTDPQPQQIAVKNSGTGSLGQLSVSAITYGSGEPSGWLSATLSGVTAPATIVLDAVVGTLVQGVYTATLQVASPDAANSPRTIAVTFTVTPPLPIIALSPTTLAFDAVQGGPPPLDQTVTVTNGGIGTLSGLSLNEGYLSAPGGWLIPTLSSPTAPATATVGVDQTGMQPGVYFGFVEVLSQGSANSPLRIPVSLTVTAPPVISLSRVTVTFSATAGKADPPTANVVVTNIGGSVLDKLAVDSIVYALGQPTGWLTASLSFPLAPSTIALDATLNPPGAPLGPGTYDATVYVGSKAAGVTNSPQILPVTFFVLNTAPVATITGPANGAAFTLGAPVTLTGTGTDAEDGVLSGASLTWISSLDGPLGTGLSITTSALSLGRHTITLTVTDSQGWSHSATIDVIVDSPPTASIVAPADSSVFNQGAQVTFTGTGTDPEDGTLTGASLTWTSSQQGAFGTGPSIAFSGLASGYHTITLIAVDSRGTADSASVVIRINALPTAAAGADATVADADNSGDEVVALDGSGSADAEGGLVGFNWSEAGTSIATGVTPSVRLTVGAHTITLTVTDGDGATASDDVVVTVGANMAPTAIITSPAAGSVIDQGTPVTLSGSGSDPEDGALTGTSLAWSSSVDGLLGTGGSLSVSTLTPGVHTITLTATDAGNASGLATVSVRINALPTANAGPDQTAIADADNSGDEPVVLDGTASFDPEGPLASYSWSESGTVLASGPAPTVTLPVGQHSLTLTVTDSDGAVDVDGVVVTIGPNAGPSASISVPADGSLFAQGSVVSFVGSGSDPEDGALTGSSLTWDSDRDGVLGTGGAISAVLTPGTHTITLTATDTGGFTGTAAVSVRVNATPTANAGPDQTRADADNNGSESVTLDGSGSSDPEGPLATYVWTEGGSQIATGVSPSVTLTVGVHSITLTVTDRDGATAMDGVVVTVGANVAPAATIGAPASGSVFPKGALINFTGSGSDPEDGPLAGASLVWTSNLGGLIGTGGSVATSTLAAATHTITLTATDAGGLTGTAAISIRVNAPPVANAGPDFTVADADNSGAESVTLNGSGSSDPEGPLASYSWTEGGTPIGTGVTPTVSLAVGAHTITLTVTDSDGTSATDVVVVTVGANRAPTASITSPASGAVFTSGTSVALNGAGSDPEDGTLTGGSLTWSSSVNGPLGSGSSLSTSALSVGAHTITLTAIDAGGLTATDAINIRINTPPVAVAGPDQTLSDADNSGNEPVTLNGSGSSDAEGALASYVWSEGANTIGIGVNPTINLPVGPHTITLTVTDSDGAQATDALTVTVGANSVPTASITSPTSGQVYDRGTSITFVGAGNDAEDGALAGASLVWTSSVNGLLGNGATIATSALTGGLHTITLTATDGGGQSGAAAISVRINRLPVANAGPDQNVTDADGSGGELIVLNGSGSTDGEGALASYVWTATGVTIPNGVNPTATFPVGVHNVTLTVTDSDGTTATDGLVVTVGANSAPTASISAPADGSIFAPGALVTFTGTGNDAEDGVLSGASLAWASSIDGPLGTGGSVSSTTLSTGTHTITLTATDSGSATGTDQITIRVNAPPTANAGPDQNVTDADGSGSESVTLDGSGSSDAEGALASYVWTATGVTIPNGVNPTATFPVGVHNVTLTVTDSDGATATDGLVVTVSGNTAPTATITAPADGSVSQLGASVTLTGTGSDPEDGTLTGTSLAWSSSLDGALGTGTSLSTTALTAGTHVITLTATDVGAATGTDQITIRVNAPPTADAGPDQNATDADGNGSESVALDGSGSSDAEGALASYVWTATGVTIPNGVNPTATFPVGIHNVTLTVTDGDGATAVDGLVVTVGGNTAPTATITAPADGSVYQQGASVTFTGTGNDAEDGVLSGASLAWASSIDGPLGTGGSVSSTTLSTGTHTITLTATDNGSATGTDQITIRVNAPPTANAGPDQNVTDADGSGSELVTLDGSGSSDAEGALASYVWTATGVTIPNGANPTATFPVGVHNVTLTVTDSDGATAVDGLVVTVGGNTAPTASITGPADGSVYQLGASVTFTGTGTDPEDGALTGASLSWTSSVNGALGTGTSLSTSTLTAGTHTITLTATDNGSATGTDQITIRVNAPPTANAGPDQNVTDADGSGSESVTLDGSGSSDAEGALASYVWTATGVTIPNGVNPTATFPVGVHNVTLTVTDSDGATAVDGLVVTVGGNTAPTASITGPADGSVYQLGASVTFTGTGTDPEDGALTGASLSWTSSVNGALGTGTSLSTSTLTAGTHTITLTATDNGSATGTDQITIRVNAPPTANAGPDQNATDADGSGSESVTLDGSGSSDAEGALASYVWTATGVTIPNGANPTATFPVGVHNVTLTVTDSDGATAVDGLVVTVGGNTAPAATITGPADGSVYQLGASVTFTGTGNDAEDGALAGASLAWASSIDGFLGTGGSVSSTTLSSGTHTITLTATDSGSATGTDQITIRVNAPPTANAGPDQNVTDADGSGSESVTLDGSGSSDAEGALASYVWTATGVTIPNGANPTATFPVGVHNVTLTVTDSDGATAVDGLVVTVGGNTAPTASITGPADGSVYQLGASVTFTGTGTDPEDGALTGASLSWTSSVNGALGTGTSLSTSTLTAGTHTITLTATDSGSATGTDQITIRVNAPPTANAGPDQNVTDADGSGSESVTLDGSGSSDAEGALASYVWTATGVTIPNGVNPTATFPVGVHNVTLTVTDSDGATAVDGLVVTVSGNTTPTATITGPTDGSVYQPGASVTFSGTGNDLEDGTLTGASLAWSSSVNGALGTGTSLSTSTLTIGTHTITLTATDSGSLTGTDQITIHVNAPPTANAGPDQPTVRDADGTGSEDVTLDGSGSSDPDGTIQTYAWSATGVTIPNGVNPTATFPLGVHTITLTVTDNLGAQATDDVVVTVLANTAPTANAGPDQNVTDTDSSGDEAVTLDGSGSSDADGTIQTYAWTATGVTIPNGVNPTATFPVGVHNVTLTVTDNGGATHQDVVVVTVAAGNQSPVANAGPDQPTVRDADGTGSEPVTLDGSGSSDPDGTIQSWVWTESATQIATGANPAPVALAVGVHTITLTVTDNLGAQATDDVVVTVLANTAPTANAGPDQNVTDTDSSGDEAVTLDGSGSSDADGTIQTYAWTATGVTIPNGVNPTATFPVGVHNVTLTVTDNGGATHQDVVVVTVAAGNQSPVANAGPDQPTVRDADGTGSEPVTLDGSGSSDPDGTIQSWVWTEGATQIATGANPAPVALAVGVHTITLTVTDNLGAQATDDVVVTVLANTAPTANAGPDQNVTDTDSSGDEAVTLDGSGSSDADGTIQTYAWTATGVTIPNGVNPTATFPVGVHNVTLTVTDNGGATHQDVVVITVLANQSPTANAGPDQPTVRDADGTGSEPVTLDGSGSSDPDGTIQSWVWTEGATQIATGANPAPVALAVGVHTITLTVTDNLGAQATDDVVVTVLANTAPTANAGPDQNVTDTDSSGDEAVTLDGSGSSDADGTIQTYAWTATGVTIPNGVNPTATFPVGVHNVTLTVTDNGGATHQDVVVITVLANQSPTANAGPDQPTVRDADGTGSEPVTLDGSGSTDPDGTIQSWVWTEGATQIATGANPAPVALAVGVHTITLTVTDNLGAQATDDVVVTVLANTAPTANAGPDQNVTDTDSSGDEAVTLDGSGSSDADGTIQTYAWTATGVTIPNGVNPTATFPVGVHNVTLTVTDNGGATHQDVVVITVLANQSPTANAGPDQPTVRDADGTGSELVTLDGSGSTDPDGTIQSWVWTEGATQIATGANPAPVALAVGVHTITLTVTDNLGAQATDDVVVTVLANTAPVANAGPDQPTVADPDNSGDQAVTLDGSGSSDADGTIQTYAWTATGVTIPNGVSPTATFPVGVHNVTLTVTDNGGATHQDVVVVTVLANQAPTANAGPDQPSVADADGNGTELVALDGSGSSDPDGSIVSWDWSGAATASGVSPVVTLSLGANTITLTVTDDGGATHADDVVVTVNANTAPAAAITAPGDGTSFTQGTQITFTGSGTDPEDGSLTGGSLVWVSDLDGQIGTGVTFQNTTLTVGTHTITLTATDAGGLTGTAVITVTIT